MGRLLGLMLFCIGIGMVIGMLIAESVIIVIAAGLSALRISYVLQIKNSPRFCEGNF